MKARPAALLLVSQDSVVSVCNHDSKLFHRCSLFLENRAMFARNAPPPGPPWFSVFQTGRQTGSQGEPGPASRHGARLPARPWGNQAECVC